VKIDLAAEFNKAVAAIPGAVPAKLEIDIGAVAVALGEAWAADMRENLLAGRRPDGKGSMPARQGGGRRGEGTGTVASISLRWGKNSNRMVIAADEENPGTLRRILRGILFRPPMTSARIQAVKANAATIAMFTASARSGKTRAWGATRRADFQRFKATWSTGRRAVWDANLARQRSRRRGATG
jgi:hypothetical protein